MPNQMDDLRRMMFSAALMGAGGNMLRASQGVPGQPAPGLGGVLGTGVQGFGQSMGQMMPLMMKMQQEQQKRKQLEGVIGTLPPDQQAMARLAPQQFVAARTKQMFAPSASPHERATEIGSTGQYRTPGGEVVNAFFDKRFRKWRHRTDEGEQDLPIGSRRITPTSTGRERMRPKELRGLVTEMNSAQAAVRQVDRYMKSVKQTGQGVSLLADKWLGKIKTIFGDVPTAQELSTLEQQGRLQGLIGRFRLETVGGGVMTEQDALRIISALGGEVNATRHPEIVRRLLGDIVKEKVIKYNEVDLPMYNDQIGRSGVYKPRKPLEMPGAFDLSTEQPLPTQAGGKLTGMTDQQLQSMDTGKMSTEELDSYIDELRRRGSGR